MVSLCIFVANIGGGQKECNDAVIVCTHTAEVTVGGVITDLCSYDMLFAYEYMEPTAKYISA